MNYKIYFASRLLSCRVSRKVSQKTLGEAIGISDAAITMLEKARRSPSFEVLCALADYFNVSIDYLVGRSDDPRRY